jgi:hypothetical protein
MAEPMQIARVISAACFAGPLVVKLKKPGLYGLAQAVQGVCGVLARTACQSAP